MSDLPVETPLYAEKSAPEKQPRKRNARESDLVEQTDKSDNSDDSEDEQNTGGYWLRIPTSRTEQSGSVQVPERPGSI